MVSLWDSPDAGNYGLPVIRFDLASILLDSYLDISYIKLCIVAIVRPCYVEIVSGQY